MCYLRAKAIGVMEMLDQGERDDKIIAVHYDDPEYKGKQKYPKIRQYLNSLISTGMFWEATFFSMLANILQPFIMQCEFVPPICIFRV